MKNSIFVIILILTATANAPAVPLLLQAGAAPPAQASERNERAFERRGKIQIRNPFGGVNVTGWDREVVRATATNDSEDGAPAEVVFARTPSASLTVTLLIAAGSEKPCLDLDISLPHDAEIESVSANGDMKLMNLSGTAYAESGDNSVHIEEATGRVVVRTTSGDVLASKVGSLAVTSERGGVEVSQTTGAVGVETGGSFDGAEIGGALTVVAKNGAQARDVRGAIDLSVVNGDVALRDVKGDVRINLINGAVNIECVRGRVEVTNVSGLIKLRDVGGDVDAATSNSPIEFRGRLVAGRRYRLKSHDAGVSMILPPDSPGFTATLSSYRGSMETDFPLAVQSPFTNRRLVGRYREDEDEHTSIQLDSFSGAVKLIKAVPSAHGNSGVKSSCKLPREPQSSP